MRYDRTTAIDAPELTEEFFREIDRRFFEDSETFLPHDEIPFDALIPYDDLRGSDVLEIGVGLGSHAALLAPHSRTFTGVDLTSYAVRATATRLRLSGAANARVSQMDAERLAFPDRSFDFIWAWGVIHHSANTRRALEEMRRVIRPGGTAVTMVYHRSLWGYHLASGLLGGIARGDLFSTRSLTEVVQRNSDGALARYYTCREWRDLVSGLFTLERLAVYGAKSHLVPLPPGSLKRAVLSSIPPPMSRLFTNRLRMGLFLVAVMRAPG